MRTNWNFFIRMEKSKCCFRLQKNDKQPPANYQPISLLPIFEKVFECFLYNEIFNFFITNHLISTIQSSVTPGDSVSISSYRLPGIHVTFDEGYEVRGVFLDILKAFDKVWHDGLIFKLEQNRISGKLLRLIKDFLSEKKQRVAGQIDNVPLGWMSKQDFIKVLYLDLYFFKFILMIC